VNSRGLHAAAARSLLLPLLAVLAIGPLLFLLLLSLGEGWLWPVLLPAEFSLSAWTSLATGPAGERLIGAALNSLALGAATGFIASLLALPLGRQLARLRGWQRAIGSAAAFLPVAAPPVSLGVGLHYSFLVAGLGGSFAGVLLGHLVPALGYASLFFMGYFDIYDDRLDEAALTLGASRTQLFRRVTLPLLRRPIIEAALLGFLVSWSQVPLTLLIGQGLVSTLPLELLTYVSSGQDRLAAAGALILTIPALLALGLTGLATRRTGAVVA
jgi:putative spermidine/putrescine transport system permease protein